MRQDGAYQHDILAPIDSKKFMASEVLARGGMREGGALMEAVYVPLHLKGGSSVNDNDLLITVYLIINLIDSDSLPSAGIVIVLHSFLKY